MATFLDNQPNAGKLISSLRNTGYDSYSAIEDIIDNSIDAHAREIYISIETIQGNLRIIIGDNGVGMGSDILDQALKLGSISDKTDVSDLGKFGMGLCTASISMAKRLEVLTREKSGECLYSSQDLDTIVSENRFIKELRIANKAEESIFSEILKNSESGTLIVLNKIDRLSDTNTSQFSNKLKKDIGRKFRKFIESGINIHINGEKIEIIDPLLQDNSGTTIYSDEVYDLPSSSISGKKESIRVKIALLPNFSDDKNKVIKDLPISIRNQGFYVMRNNREIDSAVNLDIFSKHNDFNRLRMELYFNASLDDDFGVRFSKDGVKPNQGITDFLKREIGGQISSIRKLITKEQKADPASQIDHSDSEDVIAQKAKLLITPEAKIEKRNPKTEKTDIELKDESIEPNYERKNFREIKTSPQGMGAKFESASMGREGVLYECYQEGKIIVIRWNIDHPFYERMMLENKENKNITSVIDYLIFSLASAELKSSNDDNIELLSNIKSIMSSNLRSLLS